MPSKYHQFLLAVACFGAVHLSPAAFGADKKTNKNEPPKTEASTPDEAKKETPKPTNDLDGLPGLSPNYAANKYKSRKVYFRNNITAVGPIASATNDPERKVCIPRDTVMVGVRTVTVPAKEATKDAPAEPAKVIELFSLGEQNDFFHLGDSTRAIDCLTEKTKLPLGNYQVDAQTIVDNPPSFHGFTWGGLVVPWKYQLTGKQAFSGEASASIYGGYQFTDGLLGLKIAPIAFLGLTNIKTTQTNAMMEKVESSNAGLSYGVGVTGSIYESFQLGLIVGFDHVNEDAKYE